VNYFFGRGVKSGQEIGGERAEIDARINWFDRSWSEGVGQSGRGCGRGQSGRSVEMEGETRFRKKVGGDLGSVGGTIAEENWSSKDDGIGVVGVIGGGGRPQREAGMSGHTGLKIGQRARRRGRRALNAGEGGGIWKRAGDEGDVGRTGSQIEATVEERRTQDGQPREDVREQAGEVGGLPACDLMQHG
jgi:hypothetical protein